MKKLSALRQHLLAMPDNTIDPDNLRFFVERGSVLSDAHGANEHFEPRYKATIIVLNYSGDFYRLTFWLLGWLKQNQPDHDPEAIGFEIDVLDGSSADLSLTLDLTETVKVARSPEGIVFHHSAEPNLTDRLEAKAWSLFVADAPDPVATWLQGAP